jgi:hypothetical protein
LQIATNKKNTDLITGTFDLFEEKHFSAIFSLFKLKQQQHRLENC